MDVLASLVLLSLIAADVWRLWSQGHRRTSQDLTIRRRRGVPVRKSRVALAVGSPVKGHPAQTHA